MCQSEEVQGVINVLVRRGMGEGADFVSNIPGWMAAKVLDYIHPLIILCYGSCVFVSCVNSLT